MDFEEILGDQLMWHLPLLTYAKTGKCDCNLNKETKNAMRIISARNLVISKELNNILSLFQSRNIQVIILKGTYLTNYIYPPGVRPVGDIDLLVKKQDFNKAITALYEIGIKLKDYSMPIWIHREFAKKTTLVPENDNFVPVDLHISLGPYPYMGRVDIKEVWKSSEKVNINGIQVRVLNKEYLLLHALLHLFQHRNENWLVSSCDIALLLKNFKTEFSVVNFVKLVERYQLQYPVRYSLSKVLENFSYLASEKLFSEDLEKFNKVINKKEKKIFNYCMKYNSSQSNYFIQFVTHPGLLPKLRCLYYLALPPFGSIADNRVPNGVLEKIGIYINYYRKNLKIVVMWILNRDGRKHI